MQRSLLLATALLIGMSAACLAVLLSSGRAQASFSGKNGLIAFMGYDGAGGDVEIYKMFPDGTNQKQVTHNDIDDAVPAWSPDGTKIAFGRASKIFVKDTTNGQVVRLTDNAGISSFDPAWSPDDTRIAFDSNRDGDQEIYTMNSSDGSGVRKLTNNDNFDVQPTWSPDGTKIAFNRDYDIWIMDADGTHKMNLTNSLALSEYSPDWSPDGTKIAYTNGSASDIFVMNADGSGQVDLTNTPEITEDDPAWSPDGRKVAYSVSSRDIWKINADGSNPKNVTSTLDTSEFSPSWQPISTP
jgi:Tol biopolymer transport system component